MKIIFTGGSGRFGKKFKGQTNLKNILYPTSKVFNITNYHSIKKYISKIVLPDFGVKPLISLT